jgi:hypothetical protein
VDEAGRLRRRGLETRQRRHQRLGREQGRARRGAERLEPLDRHGGIEREVADGRAAQRHQVGAAAEAPADVLRQGAYVRPLGAGDADGEVVAAAPERGDVADRDGARRALDFLAGAGVVVKPPAGDAQRRMHRRHLLAGAEEGGEHRLDLARRRGDRAGPHDRGLRVGGCGFLSEPERRLVGLGRIEQETREFRRLAEDDRQQSGGEGVERAGVARLGRGEQPLRHRERARRGDAGGLVEEQDAVERRAPSCARHRGAGARAPGA